GKKKLRLEFSPAQTMAKKSLAEIFLYPKTLRVCRPYDSHLVLDLKLLCELAAPVAVSNPPTSARWHRVERGGRPARHGLNGGWRFDEREPARRSQGTRANVVRNAARRHLRGVRGARSGPAGARAARRPRRGPICSHALESRRRQRRSTHLGVTRDRQLKCRIGQSRSGRRRRDGEHARPRVREGRR